MSEYDPTILDFDPPEQERGSALIMVLGFSMVIGTLLMGAVTTTIIQSKTIRYNFDKTYSFGIAEGVLELAHRTIIDEVSNFRNPPSSGTETLDGHTVSWTAKEIDGLVERIDDDGVRVICQPYELAVRFEFGDATARLTRIVDLTLLPIYQYALFQNFLCELSPEEPLMIEGRIHINGDLYLDSESELLLDTSELRTTGGIFRGDREGESRDGVVEIHATHSKDPIELTEENDSSSPDWIQTALREWQGTVESGAHGTQRLGSPARETIEPGGYYDAQAGLRIVGTQCFDASGASVSVSRDAIRQEWIFDEHAGKRVQVTSIDLAALARSGHYPTNGLIYASRPEASDRRPNGIQITGGAELPTPLTVVTANPLYICGDFNTIDKKPASVIADAVNLLSNAWSSHPDVGVGNTREPEGEDRDDGERDRWRGERSRGSSVAESTTYNLSIVTGVVLDEGAIAGGFGNFVRLHEDWAGKTLTLFGSTVVLFESQQATSPVESESSTAPIRVFAFDPDLLRPSFQPPYTPHAVSLRRVFWDDNQRVEFKISDSKLSLFPTTPVYDPWSYDDSFLGGVIEDPNEYLDTESRVDYSDFEEAEAPQTKTREIVTEAQDRKVLEDQIKEYGKAAKDAKKIAQDAEKALDLAGAQAALAEAQALLAAAADAYAQGGNHKKLKKPFKKVQKEVDKILDSIEKIEKDLADAAKP